MKKILVILICLSLFTLSACSNGITQEEYNVLQNENSLLQSEIKSLSNENQSLTDSYNKLVDEKKAFVMSELDTSYVRAWCATSFGDDSVCLINDTYVQCIAGKTYSISNNGISELFSDFLISIHTLAYYKENIDYDTISVKFLDENGTFIMDFTLQQNDTSYQLNSVMCNAVYADTIIPALTESINNN